MIDCDASGSTLRLLIFQALKQYSTEALLPLLCDADAIVRTAVARELQLRGGSNVFNTTIDLINSRRFETREIAAFLMGQLGTPHHPFRNESIPYLQNVLLDDYYEVRGAAAAALGHLKANEVVRDLIVLAKDPEPYVRENVAFALSQLNQNIEIHCILEELAEDSNANVREWAEFGLRH